MVFDDELRLKEQSRVELREECGGTTDDRSDASSAGSTEPSRHIEPSGDAEPSDYIRDTAPVSPAPAGKTVSQKHSGPQDVALEQAKKRHRHNSSLVLTALAAITCMAAFMALALDPISKSLSESNLPPQVKSVLKTKEETRMDETITNAYSLVKEKKFEQAEQLLQPVSDTSTPLGHKAASALAWIYGADSKYDRAEDLCKKLGGGTSGGTATSLHIAGYEADRRGYWRNARELYRRAIEHNITAYGWNDYRTAKDVFNVASCDQRNGNLKESIEGYGKAISILEKVPGAEGAKFLEVARRNKQIAEDVLKQLNHRGDDVPAGNLSVQ